MKKKISIGLLLLIVLVAIYFLFVPTKIANQLDYPPTAEGGFSVPELSPEKTALAGQKIEMQQSATNTRLQDMQHTYSQLQESRKRLKGRLAKLKASLWNLDLPGEHVAGINNGLAKAVMLLKNPPLRGAFRDEAAINKEIRKLDAAHQKLDNIEELISKTKGLQSAKKDPIIELTN